MVLRWDVVFYSRVNLESLNSELFYLSDRCMATEITHRDSERICRSLENAEVVESSTYYRQVFLSQLQKCWARVRRHICFDETSYLF